MIAEIPLTQGRVAVVDAEEAGRLGLFRWRYGTSGGYAVRRTPLSAWVPMHRDLLPPRDGFEVDHINGDRLDNRRENLRYATHAQNQHNRKASAGYSRFKGVTWCKGKWQAQIYFHGANHYLGRFASESDAARAYDTIAREQFGEFARLNLPTE